MHNDLIFDIGFHRGLDTEFYLNKGFRVIAIEANPALCEAGKRKFESFINSGQLILLNVGIGDRDDKLSFYINLDNDEWSSFDRVLGTRDGTRFEIANVPIIDAVSVFSKYGMPYYVKIDIEGYDGLVVRSLDRVVGRPAFLSVEDSGIETLIQLYNSGARRFQFLDQIEKWRIVAPNPPLEGSYTEFRFGACTSGPFGRELPGAWLDINAAAKFYVDHVRPDGRLPGRTWWDIHVQYS